MTKISLFLVLAFCCGWCFAGSVSAATIVAGLVQDFTDAGGAMPAGWQLVSATESGATGPQALTPLGEFEPMRTEQGAWVLADDKAQWRIENGRMIVHRSTTPGRHLVAVYTVQPGAAGFYAIRDSSLRTAKDANRAELRVFVRRASGDADQQPKPTVFTFVDGGELFDFDTFLGYLDAGDAICVTLGPESGTSKEGTSIDFVVERTTAIPVSQFSTDIDTPNALGGWSIATGVIPSPAARLLAWGTQPNDALRINGSGVDLVVKEGDTIVAFRVPQSGYYALHEATASTISGDVEVQVYVGSSAAPRSATRVGRSSSLNADLGYIAKGDVIAIVFASNGEAAVTFDATVVEWAPRRAPLRVRRGSDGYLDVYASDAPHTAIDIPKNRWITVPATRDDATEAIRAAFDEAKSASADAWVGIRLEAGATYPIGSEMAGGTLFELRDIDRVVFDGNGATLMITSPELQRRGFNLFVAGNGARNLVFADVVVDAATVPFTLGRIVDVNPKAGNTQTVTVEMEPGSVDPLEEITRNGRSSAYVYDPHIPGRLGFGTWSHYPGYGEGPQIKPADKPATFTHTLTRTGSSLTVGDKWLVKNKGAGVIYLTTRGDAHDITLSGIDGRASGGGTLRFWSTSAINVLDSRFEPKDRYWISSSADGIHGRGREGVWIENTIIRGVCEDIMNTYGRTMAIKPESDLSSDEISLGVFDSSVRSGRNPLKEVEADDVRVGDRLVFFAPQSGKVLGYAQVLARDGGRVKLSQAIEGIVSLTDSGSREATMVYSMDAVGNFVVRDSKFMDSMRIGIYIKARGGVVWGNTIEGQSAPAIFAANEPEWPEGPPATHLWIQGNTFSQNNYGYMSRYRDFLIVDPADITIYTRRFRGASEPDNHHAFVTQGQHANSHVKIVGNTFHDWRGMGIAVRNSKNVIIEDNLFLPPVEDAVLRDTLSDDPALSAGGTGRYAGVFLDSVGGARLAGNHFIGLPAADATIAQSQQVTDVILSDNLSEEMNQNSLLVMLRFSEWFGTASENEAPGASTKDKITLRGAAHAAGRLGAGLVFDGKKARAALPAAATNERRPTAQLTLALWVRTEIDPDSTQVVYGQGNPQDGVIVAVDRGRLVGGFWQDKKGIWIDLGPAVAGLWQHVTLVFDGGAGTLRGYVNGVEIASAAENVPSAIQPLTTEASFGGPPGPIRLGAERVVSADQGAFRGAVDEFYLFNRAISAADVATLALQRSVAAER